MKLREWRCELAIGLGSLMLGLAFAGRIGLFDVDEAIFAEATREMIVTGDFITPRYNGGERWDKPPLTYWLMAGPMKLLGPEAGAARVASAVAAALLVLLLMAHGRAVWGPAAGRWAGVIMATCLHGFALARWAAADMILTLFMAAAWVALYWAAERESAPAFALGCVALALATLTKGPVAFVLPSLSWAVYLLAQRRLWRVLWNARFWWGILLFVAVLAPWCVAIYVRHGTAFYESFLGYHNLNRFVVTQSGHGGPFFEFVLVALFGMLPWSGFALWGIAQAWRDRGSDSGRAGWYALLWLGVVLLFFSISHTKLPNYIAPLYPAAALLAARPAAAALQPRRDRQWGAIAFLNWGGMAGLGAALLTSPGWVPRIVLLERELGSRVDHVGHGAVWAGALLLAVPVLWAGAWAAGRFRLAAGVMVGGAAAACLALWLGVAPVVYYYQQGALRAMARSAAEWLGPQDTLATLNIHAPSVALTAQRTFRRYSVDRARPETFLPVRERFEMPRRVLLITRTRHLPLLEDVRPVYCWDAIYGYALLGNEPPPPGYRLPPIPWTLAEEEPRDGRSN